MRVLIDTNIFVSAVLTRQRGKTSLVEWLVFVALIAHRRFELVTSNQLLREVGDVLVRRGVAERAADSFVDSLAQIATLVRIYDLPMGCPDPGDDKVLETATNANVDVIVSRDGDLFSSELALGDPENRYRHSRSPNPGAQRAGVRG